jgi:hypothetical protein
MSAEIAEVIGLRSKQQSRNKRPLTKKAISSRTAEMDGLYSQSKLYTS